MQSKVIRSTEYIGECWQPVNLISESSYDEECGVSVEDKVAEIINAAQREADAIRALADSDGVEIRERARKDGYETGIKQAEDEYRDIVRNIENLVVEVNNDRDAFYESSEQELLNLAIAISEKILTQQLKMNPEMLLDLTRNCLKRLRERDQVTVVVNPHDMHIFLNKKNDLILEVDGVKDLQIHDDRRIERGGVQIETVSSTLDARPSSQLNVVKKALLDAAEAEYDGNENS